MFYFIRFCFYFIFRLFIIMLWWYVNVMGYWVFVVYGCVGSSYWFLEMLGRDWRSVMMVLWRLSLISGGWSLFGGIRNLISLCWRIWCILRNFWIIVMLILRLGYVVLWVVSVVKFLVGWMDVIFCVVGVDIIFLNVKWWNGVNVNLSGVVMWSVRCVSG